MGEGSKPSIRLCPACMRKIYWQEDFEGRIASGEWVEHLKAKTPESKAAFVAFTDYSGKRIIETQELTWRDANTGQEHARLHRYKADDGTIGACGHADPKRIRLPGERKFNQTRLQDDGTYEACQECGSKEHT